MVIRCKRYLRKEQKNEENKEVALEEKTLSGQCLARGSSSA